MNFNSFSFRLYFHIFALFSFILAEDHAPAPRLATSLCPSLPRACRALIISNTANICSTSTLTNVCSVLTLVRVYLYDSDRYYYQQTSWALFDSATTRERMLLIVIKGYIYYQLRLYIYSAPIIFQRTFYSFSVDSICGFIHARPPEGDRHF